jgi:hypothetical protein
MSTFHTSFAHAFEMIKPDKEHSQSLLGLLPHISCKSCAFHERARERFREEQLKKPKETMGQIVEKMMAQQHSWEHHLPVMSWKKARQHAHRHVEGLKGGFLI